MYIQSSRGEEWRGWRCSKWSTCPVLRTLCIVVAIEFTPRPIIKKLVRPFNIDISLKSCLIICEDADSA